MADILEFAPRRKKDSEPLPVSDQPVAPDASISRFEIPDLRSMYDEMAIRIVSMHGMPLAQFREKILGSVPADIRETSDVVRMIETRLEIDLATARIEMITSQLKRQQQKDALHELGRVTYAAGMRLDADRLMDMGRAALISGIGTRRALTTIESMRIASQVQPEKPAQPLTPAFSRSHLRLV